MNKRNWISCTAASLALLACGSDEGGEPASEGSASSADARTSSAPTDSARSSDAPSQPALASCVRGTLEPDFRALPLAGPAVTAGALRPGQYVISSTYLQLAQDAAAQRLFQELLAPVRADLETRSGLAALSLGQSESCAVARTLAVWDDDAAMIAFVGSPAHAAAVARATGISRGGSVVTHWTGDEASANWATAVQHVGAEDGPQY
jgi:heme-degrading monooxygenase HmoA